MYFWCMNNLFNGTSCKIVAAEGRILHSLFFIIFFFSSCTFLSNESGNSNLDSIQPQIKIEEAIDNELWSVIEKFILLTSLDTINNQTYCIEFFKEDKFSIFTEMDSLVLITSFNCNKCEMNYEGIIEYKGIFLVIFDTKNIGLSFYNPSYFVFIPNDSLDCGNENINDGFPPAGASL
jgi:hypothetical protein